MIGAFHSVGRFLPAVLGAAAGVLLLFGVGCATPGGGSDAGYIQPDYAATVNALAPSRVLPTLTPTSNPTASPQPTYTPRPRPTYTPRPLPNQNQGGGITAAERSPGLFFQATLVDGQEFDMEDTLGTPTLLAFWAHW